MMDVIAYLERERGIHFNDQQKQGVLSTETNTLLLAVPGSGKTTVLTARLAHLMLNEGVPAERLLILTYNRETARDMRRRYDDLFGKLTPAPRFSTIHSFCLSVLRDFASAYRRPMPSLISSEENAGLKTRVLREIYRKHCGEYLADDVLETLEQEISFAKNMLLSGAQLAEREEVERFPEIFADYEAFKRRERLIDFDDMLTMTLDIFTRFPAILSRFREAYDDVLVDEAQDTSLVQHRIVQLLGEGAKVFMVGDEDQSIYTFRGAYPKALLEFADHYADAQVIKMEENFRSHSDIVACANRFIQQNRQRYAKEMRCANREAGSIDVVRLRDYSEQYIKALAVVQNLPPGRTLGILYRNNESAVPLINLFYERGIRYSSREHKLSYFSSMVIRDLTAYIRLAADPQDVEAFGQIYYKLGYSKGVFDHVKAQIREYDSVWDCILALSSLPEFRRSRTLSLQRKFPRLLILRPIDAIEFIQSELGYGSYVEKRLGSGFLRISTYQKLNTAKCLAQGLKNVFDFLDKLEWMAGAMGGGQNIDRESPVTLSTLHSSKGMEFDEVVLLDIMDDILPSSDAIADRDEGKTDSFENEVRLFYVGATRAKSRLVLYTSSMMNGAPAAPSRFVADFLEGPRLPGEKGQDSLPADMTGCIIRHAMFGKGEVLLQAEDVMLVSFMTCGRKKISRTACMKNHMIEILS